MGVEIRPATAAEMKDLGILGGYVYGGTFGDGPDNIIANENRPEWTLCAFVDGQLASSFSNLPFTMRANGTALPLAGVSTIGTQPEHRRQGFVRRIHTQALAAMRDAGQPVAALWASQAAIYQRYGYALGTIRRHYSVDTVDIRFFDDDAGSQPVARVPTASAYDTLKAVYIAFVEQRMGYLHRGKALWRQNALEEVAEDGPVWVAVSTGANGEATGYVVYTLRAGRVEHAARDQQLAIRDLAWLNADAYRSLWRFIASHDLVGRVRWHEAPRDDPAPELMVEPRLLNAEDREGAWYRIVDARAALASRGYDAEGKLAIGLPEDPLTPWNNGVWQLDASPDGATARATTGEPDIRLTAKALASLWTGFRSATELAAWGLLDGDHKAVLRADALFQTRHAPHCPDHF